MEEDELERPVESVTSPIVYTYEPIRRGNRAVVREEEVVEPVIWGQGHVGNITWCQCGYCTPMPTVPESICCQEAGLDHLLHDHPCITVVRSFSILCWEVDVLEVAMLSLRDVRAETLQRPVNSSLFRLTAYRQFTLWARGHLGRKNRVPILACVVGSIRAVFPSPEYYGFEYADMYDEF